jgi:outer membrane receptor for ferrienterochelin and colicins
MTRARVTALLLGLILIGSGAARAQALDGGAPPTAAPAEPPLDTPKSTDFAELDLEQLLQLQLDVTVISSTKKAQRGAQAPAVVTVISGEELRTRGYRNLAEALRSIPGFYDLYDLVTHNMGVRGINGGQSADGNVIKLVIDGHPVDYRSTTGNYFGEELIPLQIVERVEVIRGPASALYGANAFLGVINVITQTPEKAAGLTVGVSGNLVRVNPGSGGSLSFGISNGTSGVLVALDQQRIDRSGLALPTSSPALGVSNNAAAIPLEARGLSSGDLRQPASMFMRGTVGDLFNGELTFMASLQHTSTVAEFLEFSTLSHGTRLASNNQNYRIGYRRPLGERASIEVAAHALYGGPDPTERLDLIRTDYALVRSSQVIGLGISAEAQVSPIERLSLTLGVDAQNEDHLLQAYDQVLLADVLNLDGSVLRQAGTVIPGPGRGATKPFRNRAAYAQGVLALGTDFSVTAGARVDRHNIYGLNPSARVGLVYAPEGRKLSAKLLYGSSYKAPSAVQLYTQSMGLNDIRGNQNLKPQLAHTVEAALVAGLGERAELNVNLFFTRLFGRVEFTPRGNFTQAENVQAESVAGGELELRMKLLSALSGRASVGVARVLERSIPALLAAAPKVTQPQFPDVQGHFSLDYAPLSWLRSSVELSYVSPRESSQVNALIARRAYNVPGYLFTAASVCATGKLFGGTESSAVLRITDALDRRWVEPGFGGIDFPTQGRTISLSARHSF